MCYSYGNVTGIQDIPTHDCKFLSKELQKRLIVFFDIFREAHPMKLKFVFNLNQALNQRNVQNDEQKMEMGSTNDDELNTMFDGSGKGGAAVW